MSTGSWAIHEPSLDILEPLDEVEDVSYTAIPDGTQSADHASFVITNCLNK